MHSFNVLIIRIVLGAVCAVILARFFHPEFNPITVAALGAILVGLAYLFEYMRNRKAGPKP